MKKIKYIMFAIIMMLFTTPVFADIKCNGVTIDNKIPDTVHIVILFLQIAVPVLLVIFGSIDLIKAIIAGKEDEIKKNQNVFLKRLLAGVLVFFVIAIVKLIVNFASKGDGTDIMGCADCFISGSKASGCKRT